MPSPVLPPSSLTALVSRLHPPHPASGPDEPQFSETPGRKMPEKRPSFWVISAPHPTADKPISGGPESPTPLHMGPQEVLGEGNPEHLPPLQ